jgi:hypothetical protein
MADSSKRRNNSTVRNKNKNGEMFNGNISIKNLKNSLKRSNALNRTVVIYKILKNPVHEYDIYDLLYLHSHPLPTIEQLQTQTMFELGGLRYGGRYPDIIIDKNDVTRSSEMLQKIDIDTTCKTVSEGLFKIVDYVRSRFHTDKAVKFFVNPATGLPDVSKSWESTIDLATSCFVESTYDCHNSNSCYAKKKIYTNTTTNITGLPYLIGDCREHAWLSGFLTQMYFLQFCPSEKREVFIFYTKSYVVDDVAKTVQFLEDHVFTLFISPNTKKIFVVDPLYAAKPESGTYLLFNSEQVTPVKISELADYSGIGDLLKSLCNYNRPSPSPLFECGKVFVDHKQTSRIVNVPIFYDGSLKFIDEPGNPDPGMMKILNHNYNFKNLINWKIHSSWCSKNATNK